jgi:hypothetical protein
MSYFCTQFALRALPVFTARGGVDTIAIRGLDCIYFSTPDFKRSALRCLFDGIAVQN